MNIALIITGIEALISYLLQLKANGQLTDAQLDSAVAASNTATRQLIAQFLASAGAAGITAASAVAATPPAVPPTTPKK
jgi:hypothetical protein